MKVIWQNVDSTYNFYLNLIYTQYVFKIINNKYIKINSAW